MKVVENMEEESAKAFSASLQHGTTEITRMSLCCWFCFKTKCDNRCKHLSHSDMTCFVGN